MAIEYIYSGKSRGKNEELEVGQLPALSQVIIHSQTRLDSVSESIRPRISTSF